MTRFTRRLAAVAATLTAFIIRTAPKIKDMANAAHVAALNGVIAKAEKKADKAFDVWTEMDTSAKLAQSLAKKARTEWRSIQADMKTTRFAAQEEIALYA